MSFFQKLQIFKNAVGNVGYIEATSIFHAKECTNTLKVADMFIR
jgi:hypothetical protein